MSACSGISVLPTRPCIRRRSCSRDGIHYNREFQDPFIARGPHGEFDSSVVYVDAPISPPGPDPDLLHRRYLAFSRIAAGPGRQSRRRNRPGSDPARRFRLARRRAHGLERGGYALRHLHGLAPSPEPGFGPADSWGAGAVRDQGGAASRGTTFRIPGFTLEDADPITAGATDQVVSWRGNADVSKLAGKPVKLRFHFKNAKLFSFQFR